MTTTLVSGLGVLIIGATIVALRAMHALWQDRQAEIRAGRDDGSKPWLLSRVVLLCGGATLIGLWLSILSIFRLSGSEVTWSTPVSYTIGLLVTLLPSYIAWEFRRRSGR